MIRKTSSTAVTICNPKSENDKILNTYVIDYNGKELYPENIEIENNHVTAIFAVGVVVDAIDISDDFIVLERTWTLTEGGAYRLKGVFYPGGEYDKLFIPAVSFRGNNVGSGCFPRGGYEKKWSFMEDRTPVPACQHIYSDTKAIGFAVDPAGNTSEMMSASTSVDEIDRGSIKIEILLPGEEGPLVYTGKHSTEQKPAPEDASYLIVDHSKTEISYRRIFYISFTNIAQSSVFFSHRSLLEKLNSNNFPQTGHSALPNWQTYYDLKIEHLKSLISWHPEYKLPYIAMGRGNGELQPIYDFTSASFLVKSIEGAWILAEYANSNPNRTDYLKTAEGIGRFFLYGEKAPGVHQDCFDLRTGDWGGYLGISEHNEYQHLVNSRCNGESMSSYIQLYENLKEGGVLVPEFIELPCRVADFYLKHQLTGCNAGSFGRWWKTDGTPVNTLGTNGAHIVSMLIKLAHYYHDKKRLHYGINLAAAYYMKQVDNQSFFGDTLDADAYDKESGAALLAMFLDLYAYSPRKDWLTAAEKAAEFIMTWIWQYTMIFPKDSPLEQEQFNTLGMTSVSVAHHHLDFYGIAIAYDFLRLWEITKNDLFRRNGLRLMQACKQLLNADGRKSLKGMDFIGWQPEQINHTNWDYFDRPDKRKGWFDICIAWVNTLGLGAYSKIKKRFPDYIERETSTG